MTSSVSATLAHGLFIIDTVCMGSTSVTSASTLVLVPTERELELLAPQLGGIAASATVEICGFGPVAAAAYAARLLEKQRPSQVVLAGIAGTYCVDTLPVGAACCFRRVAIDGIGVGESSRFVSAHDLGFPQTRALNDVLPLVTFAAIHHQDLLLTCCAASDSAGMAVERESRRPDAVAEDLEGFGIALACQLAGTPLTILRGISNVVGDRDKNTWAVDMAMQAVGDLLRAVLSGIESEDPI